MKKRSPIARKARRGVSLVEMGLVLVVVSILVKTAVEVSTSHTRRQVTQRAAGNMSTIADDVQTYLERTYFEVRARLEAAPGGVIEESWDDLISNNRLSLPALPVSPDGGRIRLFLTLRGDAVYAVLMSFDGAAGVFSPRPDPVTKLAGRVTPNDPTRLNGWDFSLAIPEIATLTGQDLSGNIGVIRYVSQTVNVDPYLHRIAIPGRPDLNRMRADLDMGGFDLINANRVETRDLIVQDSLTVPGRLRAGEVRSDGDARFVQVSAGSVETDTLAAANMNLSGSMSAGSVIAGAVETQSLVSASATFNSLIADFFEGGVVYLGTGNFAQLDVNELNADRIIADEVYVGDSDALGSGTGGTGTGDGEAVDPPPVDTGDDTGTSSSCFAPGTCVRMADGTERPIEHIRVGDLLEDGGRVYMTGLFLASDLYRLDGVEVTGDHLVRGDLGWIPVRQHPAAVRLLTGERLVHNLATTSNRVRAGGLLFADFAEITGPLFEDLLNLRLEAPEQRQIA
jgi:type II secretory pathway pseudopilin PulG